MRTTIATNGFVKSRIKRVKKGGYKVSTDFQTPLKRACMNYEQERKS